MTTGTECKCPPEGWLCTRTPDHTGPCAAVSKGNFPDEIMISFNVTRKQLEQSNVWTNQHNKEKHLPDGRTTRFSGAIGGGFSWEFTSTTIGMIVMLKCSCGEEIDLSDDW